ncbi:hypothetical protein JAAARDRAFT_36716 [Jaapia argillacea MUCL 33604]|uniref:Uncharacterized protein n=1 Tax=Jaapia argillacea MUCL 33604 TaxID=933084 RepID=A0A067PQ56_9AGAM|nr:hypothetical protein JAAARDRAFT_36716 [Jaapia argillacea MUCL 33604]
MSLGDRLAGDAKFPGQEELSNAEGPGSSRENPGGVYPKSDPAPAPPESLPGTGGESEPTSYIGNPFLMKEVLGKLDHALSEVITTIGGEENRVGGSADEEKLLQKFKGWRAEVDDIRSGRMGHARTAGRSDPAERGGGLFTD